MPMEWLSAGAVEVVKVSVGAETEEVAKVRLEAEPVELPILLFGLL